MSPLLLLWQASAFAAEEDDPAPTRSPYWHASRGSIDPTGAQITWGIEYEGTWSRYQVPGVGHSFELTSRVPFLTWGQLTILLAQIPYEFESNRRGGGLGTVELALFPVFTRGWGRWGTGLAVLLSPSDGESQKFQVGPALGFIWTSEAVSLGLLTRTVFGPGSAQSIVQPVLGINPTDWMTLSLGEPKETFDFVEGKFSSLEVGVELGINVKIKEQYLRFGINPEYNFAEIQGGPRWGTEFTVEVIVPGTLDVN